MPALILSLGRFLSALLFWNSVTLAPLMEKVTPWDTCYLRGFVHVTTGWHASDISDRQQVHAAGRCGGVAALGSPHFHFLKSCDVHSVLSSGPSCHLADSVSQEQREKAKSALGAEKPDNHPSSGLTFGFVAEKSKAAVTAYTEPLLWAITGMGILD